VSRGLGQHFLGVEVPDMSNRRPATSVVPEHPPALSVGDFLEDWLRAITFSLRPRTFRRYCEYVRLHILPTLGEVRLITLDARQIQLLYSEKIAQGLSPMSVLHIHRVLRCALGQAERWGLVATNAAQQADAPRPERVEMTTLSPEEARRFLLAASADRLEALYVLAITTGMRQGELLGLRWHDIDLEQRSIRVTGSLQYVPGKGLSLATPKTRRSRRHVLLSEIATHALEQHRTAQSVELANSAIWDDNDLVFPNRRGRPMYATNMLTRSFAVVLETARLPHIRFHDLRHTAATLLLGKGIHPKVVSEMLGHANTSMTLDVYSHATPTMQRQAATAFDQIFLSDRNQTVSIPQHGN
jgi:integrase